MKRSSLLLLAFGALLAAGTTTTNANDIFWVGGLAGAWDFETENWDGDWPLYENGDNVTFDVTLASVTATIAAGGVTPSTITVNSTLASAPVTFTGGAILGGDLTKNGTGTLVLANGTNSFSSITVNGGPTGTGAAALQFTTGAELGTGKITNTAQNVTLLYNSGAAGGSTATVQNAIDFGTSSAARTLRFSAKEGGAGNATTLNITGNITGGGASTTLDINSNTNGNNAVVRLAGDNSGMSMTQITVSRGLLAITSAASVGNVAAGSAVNEIKASSSAGTVLAGIRFDGSMTLNNKLVWSTANRIDTQNNNVVLTGEIRGSGAMTKEGTGSVTFAGTNIHTGQLNINAGTLITANAQAFSNSKIVVNTGGTLQIGDGITNGTTLAPGSQLIINTGGTLKFGAADSQLGIAGILTLDGNLDLNGRFNAAGIYNLITGGSVSAGLNSDTDAARFAGVDTTNFSYVLDTAGGLTVTAIPEPSTYGLLGAGLLAAGTLAIRRRKQQKQ